MLLEAYASAEHGPDVMSTESITEPVGPRRRVPWAAATLLLVVIGGAFLRLHRLGAKSLWMDELMAVQAYYEATTLRGITYLAARQAQPPLDYLIGFVISRVYDFGPWGEAVFRFPAALFSIGMIPLVYLLGVSVGGRITGLLAALVVAVSPELITYGQEARPYSISYFLYVCTLGCAYRSFRWGHVLDWCALGIATFLMLMSRGMAPVAIVVSMSGCIALAALPLSRMREGPVSRRGALALVAKSGVALGLATLAVLPFLRLTLIMASEYVSESAGSRHLFSRMISIEPLRAVAMTVFPGVLGRAWPVLLPLAVHGGVCAWRLRRTHPWALFILLLGVIEPIAHATIYHAAVAGVALKVRYVLHSLPVIAVLAAYGLVEGCRRFTRVLRPIRIACGAAVIAAVLVAGVHGVRIHYASPRPDQRAVGQYLRSEARRYDDVILFYFVPYEQGAWLPHLFGEGVYFHQVRQWYFSDYVGEVRRNPDLPNTMHFVLYTYTWRDTPRPELGLDPSVFDVRQMHEFSIIRVRDSLMTRHNALIALMDEMERFYPRNSSRARLYRNRANLICMDDPREAARYLAMAREWVPELALAPECSGD